jgi:calcineurin-like phosphoesterase family protein
MSNLWFTSDTHYHHKNIVRGTTNWDTFKPGTSHQSTRDFDTLEEHDATLVENINELVHENDVLWHIGDWSFGGHEQIAIFRRQLRCKHINLIFGNHDHHIEPLNSPYRNLFDSCQYYKEIAIKADNKWGQVHKTMICMFHYGQRVWNQSHHSALHLYGHSHGTLPGFGRSMDVGVDTNNLYPYHLDEIFDKLLAIPVEIVDHHNTNTN